MAENAGSGPGRARGRGRATQGPGDAPLRRPTDTGMHGPGSNGHSNGTGESAAARAPAQQPAVATVAHGGGPSIGRGSSRGREFRNEVAIRTRPSMEFDKKGKSGNNITVLSNYFEVISRPDMHLLQYRVDFSPDIDHMGVRKALVRVHEKILGKYLFDGTLLYNITRLHQPGQTLELVSRRLTDQAEVKITFKLVGEIQKEDAMYNTVINIIFRRCLSMLNLTEIRRNYFDSGAAQEVPQHNLTFWPGYQTSIAHHENGFLLGVEIVHKVLRRDTAYNVMDRLRRDGGDLVANVKAALEGQIVMTLYNKKTYRIDEVDFTQNPLSTFHLRKENRDITYVDYYRARYPETRVTDMKQPLLVSRPSRRDLNRGDDQPIFLIPELCSMTGLSEEQRKNFNLMRDVAQITRMNPDRRVENLMKFRRRLQDNPQIQEELTRWGLKFSNDLIKCPARVLKAETIIQGQEYPTQQGDWSRQIQRNRYCVSVELSKWVVVFPINMDAEVKAFVQMMKQVGHPHNFSIPDPVMIPMQGDRNHNYIEAIRNECSRNEYEMVLIVLRAARTDIYQAVKNLTLVEFGVPSQVVTQRVIRGEQRKVMSVATKVTVQVASKLGAEPWRVKVPNTKWMVVGYDTYHDARQSRAVGAFVASINASFTRYNSSVEVHRSNEEISPSFRQHMLNSLKAFYQTNRFLPDKIIMYRDGVGAGDIARLKETEVAALKAACKEAGMKVNQDYNPGIAFIVVSKRINTRFFTNGGGRAPGNPECGTVVDDVVTLSERYDFFVVPQKTTQGSVSPTSFNIIDDSSGLAADIQHRLANALTHVYFNWPGTLRVPGPVQYAHKLAYLVGESLNLKKPHEGLSKLPYYL